MSLYLDRKATGRSPDRPDFGSPAHGAGASRGTAIMRTAVTPEVRFVGVSEASRQVLADIDAAALSDAKVLITGETGVGKDVVARLIHQRSARRQGPMATGIRRRNSSTAGRMSSGCSDSRARSSGFLSR